jgi:hypothetical protein
MIAPNEIQAKLPFAHTNIIENAAKLKRQKEEHYTKQRMYRKTKYKLSPSPVKCFNKFIIVARHCR